jgi:glycogen operon protein
VFRRRRFLTGVEATELGWYTPAGTLMTAADWNDPGARSVTVYLDGSDAPDRAADGTLLVDDDFLLLINAWWESLDFVLPDARPGQVWQPAVDTYEPTGVATPAEHGAGDRVAVRPRSVVVLRGRVRPS